jgi:predicted aspartyl protease
LRGISLVLLLSIALLASPRMASSATGPAVAELLANYARAIDDPGALSFDRLESIGSISGAGLSGGFHTWADGDREREDQRLGPRSETTLRLGERVFYANADGNVREFTGVMLRRARTARFIDSGDFAKAPERCVARGLTTIGGRNAYALDVTAQNGETETLYLDATTWLPERVAYDDDDGRTTIDLSDWRTVAGHRFPFKAVVSDGDPAFDTQQLTESVVVNQPIDAALFRPLANRTIEMAAPQTIAMTFHEGHLYVPVTIAGRTYNFLVDTGAQNILVDARVAREAGLATQGALEASGAQRTGGLQVARLAELGIGNGHLRDLVVTTLDLGRSTSGAFRIDGILGYPFFAAATVKIDHARLALTFGPPGSFAPTGTRIAIETDRAFPEAQFRINNRLDATFLVDTGNAAEVLFYRPFVNRYPGVVPPALSSIRHSYGIGGSIASYHSSLDEIDLAGIPVYHADADVILATKGAFADRFDAGNVGLGLLKNFVVTFDEAAGAIYIERGPNFDDGRSRH